MPEERPQSSGAPSATPHPADHAVAVTGLGAVSAWGWSAEAFWQGLVRGTSAIGTPERFDVTGQRTDLASEVPLPDDRLAALTESSAWARWSHADRFAVAAADEAWRDAGLDMERIVDEGLVVGVFFGGSTAAMPEGETFFRQLTTDGGGRPKVGPLASHQLNGPGDAVARHLRVGGRVETLSSACASGGLAIGSAVDALRRGEVDVAITGGADALCQLTYAGFNSLRAVDAARCSPFRSSRAGLNLGEGAGVLVLERTDQALARGRTPRGLVLGHGASCDAHHMTAPHPEGDGAARAIQAALADAALEPDEIAFVNAHGTGTPLNDAAEGKAVARVFGARSKRLPLTSTKGAVGHFLGSSGAIEAVATILCLRHGQVHPTPGDGEVDPDIEVDLVVGMPRPFDGRAAVSTSFAFGGSNAAVVFGRWSERET